MTHPTWIYQNQNITDIQDMPEGTYGFIYQVTHIPTGKKYIGKKVLYFERNKKLGKKEQSLLQEQRKSQGLRGPIPSTKKVITESDWRTYYGSQKEILDLVKQGPLIDFKREILQYVSNKKHLTYYECKYLFINEVLENPKIYLNSNILGKFFQSDFIS